MKIKKIIGVVLMSFGFIGLIAAFFSSGSCAGEAECGMAELVESLLVCFPSVVVGLMLFFS